MYFYFSQPIKYRLVTNLSQLPLAISLNDIKAHLRIDFTQEDGYLTNLIKTAIERFENITTIDLITKTYKTYLDTFPCIHTPIKIKRSKLQSIISIQYYLNNVLTTFDSSNYYFDDSNQYSHIFLKEDKEYPTTIDNMADAVIINFTSGFGSTDASVPFTYKQALLEYIAFLYKNRGDSCCNNMGIAMSFFNANQIEPFV
ncbi:MAG: hypothetical protein RIR01_1453 [Bacteroidota bacterium]|jgi:uncharacterized phiE125 gp8 family phage protein